MKNILFLKYIIKLSVLSLGSTRLGRWPGSSWSSARPGQVGRARQCGNDNPEGTDKLDDPRRNVKARQPRRVQGPRRAQRHGRA